MKTTLTICKFFAAIVLVALAAGCASDTSSQLLDRENAAIGAGFKVITPTKPAQLALLQKLAPVKVTPITHGGKPYFILPDLANNCAYVGGPKQYQVYKQFRLKQKKNYENYEATPGQVEIVEVNSMDWGEWGGWGPGEFGGPGWY